MLKDILGVRWVEQLPKRGGGPVTYVPDAPDLPLSRAPRTQLELRPDGSASVFVAGPADRPMKLAAQWEEEGGDIVIRTSPTGGAGSRTYRVVQQSPDRLVVREYTE
jgi:hypothetical protein